MEFNNAQRAEVLITALPYIKEYCGKTVVVKYGGNAMSRWCLFKAAAPRSRKRLQK